MPPPPVMPTPGVVQGELIRIDIVCLVEETEWWPSTAEHGTDEREHRITPEDTGTRDDHIRAEG